MRFLEGNRGLASSSDMSASGPCWFALLVVAFSTATVRAEEAAAEAEAMRKTEVEQMKQILDDATIETGGDKPEPLTRSEHPILRYTNPVTSAFGHGALFLILQGKRPVAAAGMSSRENGFYWELSSLTQKPLKVTRNGKAVWSPPSSAWKPQAVPDAPIPAESPTARLTQMRAIARQFSVTEERRNQWQEGRLLTQPLHRWEDEKAGAFDGALFAYAETTDPELLLLLEARKDAADGKAAWVFTLAKMTASPVKVSFKEKEIWTVDGYWRGPRTPQDPYVEQLLGKFEAK